MNDQNFVKYRSICPGVYYLESLRFKLLVVILVYRKTTFNLLVPLISL
jgi:hypothetical protein